LSFELAQHGSKALDTAHRSPDKALLICGNLAICGMMWDPPKIGIIWQVWENILNRMLCGILGGAAEKSYLVNLVKLFREKAWGCQSQVGSYPLVI
jgi:hypothetical protein